MPLLFEMLGNMCIVITCFPVCGVINFEINLNPTNIYLFKGIATLEKGVRYDELTIKTPERRR